MELTEFGRALEEHARARGGTLQEFLEHIERDATEEDQRMNRAAIYREAEEANAERGEA